MSTATALIVLCFAEFLVIVGLVLINRAEVDRSAKTLIEVNEANAQERSELLNRIQAPNWLAPRAAPSSNGPDDDGPPQPPDEIGKVGTVVPMTDEAASDG